MHKGAFALVDCLGFKGVWARYPEQAVMDRLVWIKDTVDRELRDASSTGYLFDESIFFDTDVLWSVSFLSDSVAVGAQWKTIRSGTTNPEAILIDSVGIALQRIVEMYVNEEPYLTMRGCISFGLFEINGNFIVGPAVDVAAENMNLGDGAFVWMHKSAEKFFSEWKHQMLGKPMLPDEILPWMASSRAEAFAHGNHFFPYEMPLKGGGNLQVYVLNPLGRYDDPKEAEDVVATYRKSMTGLSAPVSIKQQNTLRMLERASENTKEYYNLIILGTTPRELDIAKPNS